MARFRANRVRQSAPSLFCLVLSLILNLVLNQACARSEPANSTANQSRLPFHTSSDLVSGGDSVLSPAADPKHPASLPFRSPAQPRILPAGTLLTVQLKDSLSAATARDGDTFTAFVAAPLTLDGNIVLDRSALVTGRIESARTQSVRPGSAPDSAYFRLTVSAITVEGRQVALQTSSLFARGTFQPPAGVEVRKGRHLTFRLTAPLVL
jgi:hypothetical protein